MSRREECIKASYKLDQMSKLMCFHEEYKTALQMGAMALEILSKMEQINEIAPITKDKVIK